MVFATHLRLGPAHTGDENAIRNDWVALSVLGIRLRNMMLAWYEYIARFPGIKLKMFIRARKRKC
jgi:hypothetical protein